MLEIGRLLRLEVQEVDTEHTRYIPAGRLQFGVESRVISPDGEFLAILPTLYADADADERASMAGGATAAEHAERPAAGGEAAFAAAGPSIHVFDAETGLEHLRFDLFDNEPHYHYLSPGRDDGYVNRLCVIDTVMITDLVGFAMGALRERLPAMLTFAGAAHLADNLDAAAVGPALDEVERLLSDFEALVPR